MSPEKRAAKKLFWQDIEKQPNFWRDIPVMLNTEYLLTTASNMGNYSCLVKHHKKFVGRRDETVPYELVKTWAKESDIILIPNATHDDFGNINLFD